MKVFFIKRKTIFVAMCIFFFCIIGIPSVRVDKKLSSETKEYWEGSNDIIWGVNTKEKMIALTFDDGPSPTFTPQILDILKEKNVKATFFVIAKEVKKHPEIVQRAFKEGNEIGNHTYNHNNLRRYSREELEKEISDAEKTLQQIIGGKPRCFRPPEGYYNEDVVMVAKKLGYKVVIWSWEQQSGDWANPGTSTIIKRVLKNVASGNIVVFHDRGGNRTQTVQALGPIIDELKKEGFKLVTLSEMLRNAGQV